jgi:DNA-binding transcriptional LysR family regulator
MNDAQLRRLDAGLLLVFEEVLRTGNLSKASERLRLTPSAVSHALARLRDIFGDPLFLRRPQGVAATPRALALREPIARALGALRGALVEEGEFRPDSIDRLFQIAALDALIVTLAPKLLARLAREAPEARLAFRSFGREETRKAVRDGRVDLALGVFETPGAGMTKVRLGMESFAVVARKGHPLFRDGMWLETWLATDQIVVSAAGDLAGAIDPVLAARGLMRRTRAAVPQFLAAFATIAAGEATASVPESLAKTFAEPFGLAVYKPPIDLPPFELSILRARAEAPDPALDWLVQAIVEIRGEGAGGSVLASAE